MSPNPRTKLEHSSLLLPKLLSLMGGTASSLGTLCLDACSEQPSPRAQHLPKTYFRPDIRPLILSFLLKFKAQ